MRLSRFFRGRTLTERLCRGPGFAENGLASTWPYYRWLSRCASRARIAWREPRGQAWQETAVYRFERARATELWAGRAVPSRHNASAPDLRFANFSAAPR
jgi:hypothetical protein